VRASVAIVVLQARVGSTRLPGKVLARINGRTVLRHAIDRLRAADVGPLIVATTTRSDDNAVEREARACGAAVVRGPVADVLARFMLALAGTEADFVIRATADNPAVDIDAPRRTLGLLRIRGADHAVESGLPIGAAVEAVRRSALERAAAQATGADDREHVTPFVRRDPQFIAVTAPAPQALVRPDLRLTIDTAADLDHLRRVLAGAPSTLWPLQRIIGSADRLRPVGATA
jgi:spore coat polysaccharide biosynthesis protein SpsF